MDRVNRSLIRLIALTICSIFFLVVIHISDVTFILKNSYIVFLFISFVIMIIIEIIECIVTKKTNKNRLLLSIRFLICLFLLVFVILSLFIYKREEINDDNDDIVLNNLPTISIFSTLNKEDIVCTDGMQYKTILTEHWQHYLTGTPYNKDHLISGIKVDYIDFKKNFISNLLSQKYYDQLLSDKSFHKKDELLVCEEYMLDEKQISILYKKDTSIMLILVYTKKESNTDDIVSQYYRFIQNDN